MALVRYIQFENQSGFTTETFGAFGVNSHVIDPVGEDINGDQQYLYPRTAGLRNIRGRIQGPKKFSGPIDTPLYPTHAASLLHYTLGATATTTDTPTTNVNTHVVTKADSIPFFRMGVGRQLNEHQYVGGIINSFSADYSPDEILTGSFETVIRRELALGTLDTDAAFTDYDDVDGAFGGTEVTPSIDSTAVTFIESASISVENNVADDAYALGNAHLPAGIVAGLNVSGSFDLRYDANSRYSDWINGTVRQFDLDGSRGAAASQRQIKLDCPVISYDVNRLPTDNIERYVQTLDWTATPDSNGDPLICTIINEQTNAQFVG